MVAGTSASACGRVLWTADGALGKEKRNRRPAPALLTGWRSSVSPRRGGAERDGSAWTRRRGRRARTNSAPLPFVDADAEIEKAANAPIPEIFARHGEAYFRDGERRVIRRLLDGRPKVLATGGGAFMSAETRQAIAEGGISVWLEADLDVLMARVRKRSNRPLLMNDDPEGTMRRLIDERYPIYALADIRIRSRDVAHEVVADEVLQALVARIAPAETRETGAS
ncbi:MAG: shikimate kinase [Rhizobiales bacterium]|nr:shikimate kinase [Hyphomicrobiales bacterium]